MSRAASRGGFALVLAATCACGLWNRPDASLLPAAVADIVVAEGLRNDGSIVIVDSSCFQFADPGVLSAIRDRLTEKGIPWKSLEMPCDVERVESGTWLLRLDLRGSGRSRTLTWTLNCGPKCGIGEKVDLRWKDGAWTHERVAVIEI